MEPLLVSRSEAQCRGYTRFLFFIVLTGFMWVLRNNWSNSQDARTDEVNQNKNPSIPPYNTRSRTITYLALGDIRTLSVNKTEEDFCRGKRNMKSCLIEGLSSIVFKQVVCNLVIKQSRSIN